ncbi:MAG: hypothetical protein IPM46_05410 [Flavobacteriales bacterium]|nr:hypothetical protein [Flavobacteriales bacterium]
MRAGWVLPFLLMACGAPDRGGTRIIGHGGLGVDGDYPMNSRESLLGALELGVDGIEMDVQLTRDNVLVAYHPADLGELTTCAGRLNGMTWMDLKACPVRKDGKPYPIVRVDSLLMEVAALRPFVDFTLDCKLFAAGDWWEYLNAFSDAIVELDEWPALHGRTLVDCQTEDFIRLLAEKRQGFPAFLYVTTMKDAVQKAATLGCAGITVEHSRASADEVRSAHDAGLQVTFFGTGGGWSHRSALSKRPDRLQTDAPTAFVR